MAKLIQPTGEQIAGTVEDMRTLAQDNADQLMTEAADALERREPGAVHRLALTLAEEQQAHVLRLAEQKKRLAADAARDKAWNKASNVTGHAKEDDCD